MSQERAPIVSTTVRAVGARACFAVAKGFSELGDRMRPTGSPQSPVVPSSRTDGPVVNRHQVLPETSRADLQVAAVIAPFNNSRLLAPESVNPVFPPALRSR